jgi:hypothetical protein
MDNAKLRIMRHSVEKISNYRIIIKANDIRIIMT